MEPSYIAVTLDNDFIYLRKLTVELLHDQAMPFLRVYFRELKTYVHKKTCAQMFMARLFLIPKSRNNPDVYHGYMDKK